MDLGHASEAVGDNLISRGNIPQNETMRQPHDTVIPMRTAMP
jgi:hypothetical protein